MRTIPPNNPYIAWTHASGAAAVLEKPIRVCLGNPAHPRSMWNDNPVDIPWSLTHLEKAIEEVYALPPDLEVREKVIKRLKQAKYEKMNVYPFPWIQRDIRKKKSFIGLVGGRNSTKSTATADWLLLEGARRPIRYACARQFFANMRDSVQETLGHRIQELNLQEFYEVKGTEVVGRLNDSHFIFMGLDRNPEAIKSIPNLTGFWMEEAQDIPIRAFNVSVATMRTAGYKCLMSWNPTRDDDAVHQFFFDEKGQAWDDPTKLVIESNWEQSPFITYDTYLRIMKDKERNIVQYNHEYGGEFAKNTRAQIYTNWKDCTKSEAEALESKIIERRIAPIFGLDVSHGGPDPYAFIEAYPLFDEGILYIADERYEYGLAHADLPSFLVGPDEFNETPLWSGDRHGIHYAYNYPIIADHGPDIHKYLTERGFKIMAAYKNQKGYSPEAGIRRLQDWDIRVSPDCKQTLYEFKRYRFKVEPRTEKVTTVIEKANDHLMDALRYAIQALPRNLYNPEWIE